MYDLSTEFGNRPVSEVIPEFVDLAGASGRDQVAVVRASLAGVSGSEEVAQALFLEISSDLAIERYERAVVGTGLLGQMRNDQNFEMLMSIVELEVPQDGTWVQGEILEASGLAEVQMKAVDGIAYMRTAEAYAYVLGVANWHEHVAVRAEAAFSYIWNSGGTSEARETARGYLRQEEALFADRLWTHEVSGQEFDGQLGAYLQAHPELIPPEPGGGLGDESTPAHRW